MPSLETLLKVNKHDLSSAISGAKRFARVEEAISWPLGVQGSLIYQTIWESDKYKIKLGKPGKEAAADYDRCKYLVDGHRGNNPNDMKPEIFCGNELFENKIASWKVPQTLDTFSMCY